jgi:large subunit ribosomal protein L10
MPTEAKRATVAALTEAFSAASTSIVTDYRGLSVADLAAIRRALQPQGVTYRVVKNRLAKIAAERAERPELGSLLDGPSAIALGSGDEVAVARALLDAIRPYRNLKVRGAVLRQRRIGADDVARLATLPGREQLLGQLAGAVGSPLTTLASLLAAPLRNLGYALRQLQEQRAGEPGEAV